MPLELHIWFTGDRQPNDAELLEEIGRKATREYRFTDFEVTEVPEK